MPLPARRADVARTFTDERLADVLEELPRTTRWAIIAGWTPGGRRTSWSTWGPTMRPDLLAELSDDQSRRCSTAWSPERHAVRRLPRLRGGHRGGIMTSGAGHPGPEATIAEGPGCDPRRGLAPASATTIYICRAPPRDAYRGRFLGVASAQRLPASPPHSAVGKASPTRGSSLFLRVPRCPG